MALNKEKKCGVGIPCGYSCINKYWKCSDTIKDSIVLRKINKVLVSKKSKTLKNSSEIEWSDIIYSNSKYFLQVDKSGRYIRKVKNENFSESEVKLSSEFIPNADFEHPNELVMNSISGNLLAESRELTNDQLENTVGNIIKLHRTGFSYTENNPIKENFLVSEDKKNSYLLNLDKVSNHEDNDFLKDFDYLDPIEVSRLGDNYHHLINLISSYKKGGNIVPLNRKYSDLISSNILEVPNPLVHHGLDFNPSADDDETNWKNVTAEVSVSHDHVRATGKSPEEIDLNKEFINGASHHKENEVKIPISDGRNPRPNEKLNEEQLENLIQKIIKLHSLGYVHNDLLKKNIFLLLNNKDVDVIDFSMAKKNKRNQGYWDSDWLSDFKELLDQDLPRKYGTLRNILNEWKNITSKPFYSDYIDDVHQLHLKYQTFLKDHLKNNKVWGRPFPNVTRDHKEDVNQLNWIYRLRKNIYLDSSRRFIRKVARVGEHFSPVELELNRLFIPTRLGNSKEIIMKFIKGETVAERLSSGIKIRQRHFEGILSKIIKLHKMGFTHNDLTIDNIMLDGTGKGWILDFSEAKFMLDKPPTSSWINDYFSLVEDAGLDFSQLSPRFKPLGEIYESWKQGLPINSQYASFLKKYNEQEEFTLKQLDTITKILSNEEESYHKPLGHSWDSDLYNEEYINASGGVSSGTGSFNPFISEENPFILPEYDSEPDTEDNGLKSEDDVDRKLDRLVEIIKKKNPPAIKSTLVNPFLGEILDDEREITKIRKMGVI